MVSALKGAKTIRLFALQIPWRRKLERSDEFKSSNKRVRPLFLPGRWKDVRKSSEAVLFLSRCSYLVHNHQHHHCSFHCRLERAGDDRRENEIPIKGSKVEHCISYACIDWLFFVGILAQPIFTAGMISVLLQESDCQLGVIQIGFIVLVNCLFTSSVLHLALASGERYVAIKYPFQYITIVKESRLLVASLLTWLLGVTVHIALAINTDLFFSIINTVIGLSVAVIVCCHLSVFLETRRHEQQVAAQQITEEARKQFEQDKKAFKLTSTIVGVLLLCYSPWNTSLNTFYMIVFFAITVVFLNSLLNPIIYCIRIRQFRVAIIELTFRTVTLARAEEVDMQWFGAKNVVVGRDTGQDQGIKARTTKYIRKD